MSNNEPDDESADSQQESEQQPADSGQPSAQSDEQSAEQSDQSAEQVDEQTADTDQAVDQSDEQPTDSDQPAEESDASEQSTEPSDEQPADSDQSAEQSEEQPAESDQPAEQSEEQPTDDQPAEQVEEQPADSEQPTMAGTADDTLAFAGDAASPGGGGLGVQARLPSRQPTRAPRAPVPQAPVKHDFAVRFTFLTSLRGFPAKGFYRFEISSAEGGTMLATHDWSPVSVTVPLVFKFSLTQITRYGEKIPSFDFNVSLSWLPFSTTPEGTPADPNDPNYAHMIEKDSRRVTTLRPKDNDPQHLTIPPPKGTAVTKIDLQCSILIEDLAVRVPSTNQSDFITALYQMTSLEELVEKGPPIQSTKDGVNTFLYEIKYYRDAAIKGATVLP